MIKKLVKHGNSRALIVDKSFLEAAGLTEDALFQVIVNPNGGLLIESVEDSTKELVVDKFNKLNKKYKDLMKRLADL